MEEKIFSFIEKYMSLSSEEKQAITELANFREYEKGTVLLREGDFSDESYFVLQGCLRCYYIIDGEEKTTAFYTESQGVTPLCVISKSASCHFVSCVENSIILVSNPYMEAIMFQRFPRFETLCRLLSEELLAKSQASFDHFKNSSPEERYLHLLSTRPDLLQRVPQHQIASYLGIKPESLSRIRGRISRQDKQ